MSIAIKSNQDTPEYFFDEGCYIRELWNTPADLNVSVAQARVAPGQTTRLHRLENTVERYLILQGTGEVVIGDEKPATVHKNDLVHIPENCPQKITNTGTDDLVFLAICSPRFLQENYRDIDE